MTIRSQTLSYKTSESCYTNDIEYAMAVTSAQLNSLQLDPATVACNAMHCP